jgi:hypothetical protein
MGRFLPVETKIPAELKSELPPTRWGKVLGATPVVMTVIATMLAGLSSSEMTRAQYERSLAAQLQSKAGDQWGLFQAKRLRGAMQTGTLELLQNTTELHPVDLAALRAAAAPALDDPAALGALAPVLAGALPVDATPRGPADARMHAAVAAMEAGAPDAEQARLIHAVPEAVLSTALRAAQDEARRLDAALLPANRALERTDAALAAHRLEHPGLNRDFAAVRLRFATLRYEAEARLNQAIAVLYEVEVRQRNLAAERHHFRSQYFFYGMLAAQAAVIIATFSIAARRRNFLWSLAAAAGFGAVTFAAYIYLYV